MWPKVKSQFTQSNTALTGGGFFIHNNINNFMVYPNIGGKTSHQYNITSIENIDEGNSNSTLRWAIPSDENALPAHTLTTYGALVDYLPKNNLTKSANLSSNSTIVYLYVPGVDWLLIQFLVILLPELKRLLTKTSKLA